MKAASLFETLIVLGIFSLLVMLMFPYSLRLINQKRADAEAKEISYEIFRQQQEAYSGNLDKPYGVAFFSDRIVAFRGASLAQAEASDTIPVSQPIRISNIALSSGNEVVFSAGAFRPNAFGYVSVTDSQKTYRVEINSEGMISYYPQ